jgi:hypothetical protein
MKCPHCSQEITDDMIAHYLASKRGKWSKLGRRRSGRRDNNTIATIQAAIARATGGN